MFVIVKMVNDMISMNFVVVVEHFQPTTTDVAFARAALLVTLNIGPLSSIYACIHHYI
jgi:hypothetical protein